MSIQLEKLGHVPNVNIGEYVGAVAANNLEGGKTGNTSFQENQCRIIEVAHDPKNEQFFHKS